ncbi:MULTISPECIES: hypothetical protein [Pseudomonas]|uniref:hypothetical protein n=1 Tax=Pseudomonas TaxID=286 RepID=UPI0011A2042F|nr:MULTISPECIES: hypothetical protein [Pseudomonas]MBI6924663.1 hypothetical protein [Pseudomonas putida]
MTAFIEQPTTDLMHLEAINRWFSTLDDHALRNACPSVYHQELLRQADEMKALGLIAWKQWRDLGRLADRSLQQVLEAPTETAP